MKVSELAARLGKSERQIRAAVHSLHARGLVVLTKESGGWAGVGERGRIRPHHREIDDPDGEHTRAVWEWVPVGSPGFRGPVKLKRTTKDGQEQILVRSEESIRYRIETSNERVGMPIGPTLLVWLPEKRKEYVVTQGSQAETMGRGLGKAGNGERYILMEMAKEL